MEKYVTKETYDRDMELMKAQNEEILATLRPMAEVFNGISFTSRWTVKILTFMAIVGAAVGALVYLTSFLKKV